MSIVFRRKEDRYRNKRGRLKKTDGLENGLSVRPRNTGTNFSIYSKGEVLRWDESLIRSHSGYTPQKNEEDSGYIYIFLLLPASSARWIHSCFRDFGQTGFNFWIQCTSNKT